MGIFNFKKSKRENDPAVDAPAVVTPLHGSKPESATSSGTLTVSYATGWPIDVVYGYLRKNYEDQGLQDALLNSNLQFRDMNMDIIRNKILMVFREINLNYDATQSDLEIRMENCRIAGLLTTVSQLQKSMEVIHAHKAELKHLEEDFKNNANEASVPLLSYSAGFLRGISQVSLAGIPVTATIQPIPSMTNTSSDTAPLDAQKSA